MVHPWCAWLAHLCIRATYTSVLFWNFRGLFTVDHQSVDVWLLSYGGPHHSSWFWNLRMVHWWICSPTKWITYHEPDSPFDCDSKTAQHVAHNDVFHEWAKHLEIDCHFAGEYIHQCTILWPFSSAEQLADFFTKSHSVQWSKHLLYKFSMLSYPIVSLMGAVKKHKGTLILMGIGPIARSKWACVSVCAYPSG